MIPHDLRIVLAKLELLSHGSTAKIDANKVHGTKDRPAMPGGDSYPPHIEYRERYLRAFSDASREAIRIEAEDCLRKWKCREAPKDPEYGSYHWRLMIANSDKTGAELARLHGVSRQTVQTYRKKYRKDAA